MRRVRTSVSASPDSGRMAALMARPGIDTRVWVTLAVAATESYVDAKHGVFVDVLTLPTELELTARVPAGYTGNGFGFYAPIHKDDELIVVIPSGDPAEGAQVVGRGWNTADKPPQEAIDHPEEVLLVAESGKTVRIVTSGAGKVYVKSADTVTLECDKVRLGVEGATEQVVLGSTFRSNQKTMDTSFQTQFSLLFGYLTAAFGAMSSAAVFHLIPIAGPMLGAPFLTVVGVQLQLAAASFTALNLAVTAFETTPVPSPASISDSYLSNVSKTK